MGKCLGPSEQILVRFFQRSVEIRADLDPNDTHANVGWVIRTFAVLGPQVAVQISIILYLEEWVQ